MRSITVHELNEVLGQRPALLVDVREPWEYAEGHLPGARPVPLSQVPSLVGTLPTDQPVYLVCAVGARSGQAAAWLGRQGYDTVNVAGGTQDWVAAGYPLER
jgi:rhodanese-related sulfurtransferase